MLLVSCPECRIEISGRPALCSNCGTPLGEAVLKQCELWLKRGKILWGSGIGLVIWGMIDHVRPFLWYGGWLLIIIGMFFTIWAQYTSTRVQR